MTGLVRLVKETTDAMPRSGFSGLLSLFLALSCVISPSLAAPTPVRNSDLFDGSSDLAGIAKRNGRCTALACIPRTGPIGDPGTIDSADSAADKRDADPLKTERVASHGKRKGRCTGSACFSPTGPIGHPGVMDAAESATDKRDAGPSEVERVASHWKRTAENSVPASALGRRDDTEMIYLTNCYGASAFSEISYYANGLTASQAGQRPDHSAKFSSITTWEGASSVGRFATPGSPQEAIRTNAPDRFVPGIAADGQQVGVYTKAGQGVLMTGGTNDDPAQVTFDCFRDSQRVLYTPSDGTTCFSIYYCLWSTSMFQNV
ncbi:hypothetical protein LTR50_006227 [Elasticomyces elasticus]|nr:hypothetical protein LTR50_006227 [Elasticomyces elasticus]